MTANKTYDYESAMKKNINDYIDANLDEYMGCTTLEELSNSLADDLWNEDCVTGNASGSYTMSRELARECIAGNEELLAEALEEFDGDYKEALTNPEYADVTIRCYLLHDVVAEVVNDRFEELAAEGIVAKEVEQ